MRSIIAIVAFLASLLISSVAVSFFVGQTLAVVEGFTHSVFGENFGYPS